MKLGDYDVIEVTDILDVFNENNSGSIKCLDY